MGISTRCGPNAYKSCRYSGHVLCFTSGIMIMVTHITCITTLFSFYYGRPLSVAWAKSTIFCQCFFIIFLWPLYSPALVNGGSQKFYTWWILSVIREVTTWIFSWSSLNYRVGQKVTKFGVFQTPPTNFLLSRLNAAEYCNSEKKLVKHIWLLYSNATFGELWPTNPWDPRATKFLKNDTHEYPATCLSVC